MLAVTDYMLLAQAAKNSLAEIRTKVAVSVGSPGESPPWRAPPGDYL